MKIATNDKEWDDLRASDAEHFIRDENQWLASVHSRQLTDHPLIGLDEATITEFTSKLKFKNGGIAHISYGMIKEKISADQFKRLLQMLGISEELFGIHQNFGCFGPVCTNVPDEACFNNCR